jgi:hypothetical protein
MMFAGVDTTKGLFSDGTFVGDPSNPTVTLGDTPVDLSATPIPGALPLFVSGLGAIGLLGWRRKRKAAASWKILPQWLSKMNAAHSHLRHSNRMHGDSWLRTTGPGLSFARLWSRTGVSEICLPLKVQSDKLGHSASSDKPFLWDQSEGDVLVRQNTQVQIKELGWRRKRA